MRFSRRKIEDMDRILEKYEKFSFSRILPKDIPDVFTLVWIQTEKLFRRMRFVKEFYDGWRCSGPGSEETFSTFEEAYMKSGLEPHMILSTADWIGSSTERNLIRFPNLWIWDDSIDLYEVSL